MRGFSKAMLTLVIVEAISAGCLLRQGAVLRPGAGGAPPALLAGTPPALPSPHTGAVAGARRGAEVEGAVVAAPSLATLAHSGGAGAVQGAPGVAGLLPAPRPLPARVAVAEPLHTLPVLPTILLARSCNLKISFCCRGFVLM